MFIILLTVGTVGILAVATVLAVRVRADAAARDGQGFERRFGPEYDRVLARHSGDRKATGRELGERLKRYGPLRVLPLKGSVREQYLAQWHAVQESFAKSPYRAAGEAEVLLTQLAIERGYPADVPFEERAAALSVHHARRVHGYRRIHEVRRAAGDGAREAGEGGVEELREALLEARALFDSLLNARASATVPERRQPGARSGGVRSG